MKMKMKMKKDSSYGDVAENRAMTLSFADEGLFRNKRKGKRKRGNDWPTGAAYKREACCDFWIYSSIFLPYSGSALAKLAMALFWMNGLASFKWPAMLRANLSLSSGFKTLRQKFPT